MLKKTFKIPLVYMSFTLYVGDDAWKTFRKAAKGYGHTSGRLDREDPGGRPGVCWGQFIWMKDLSYIGTLFHEVSHLLDNLYDSIGCEKEDEFKANLAEWVHTTVTSWYFGVKEIEKDG